MVTQKWGRKKTAPCVSSHALRSPRRVVLVHAECSGHCTVGQRTGRCPTCVAAVESCPSARAVVEWNICACAFHPDPLAPTALPRAQSRSIRTWESPSLVTASALGEGNAFCHVGRRSQSSPRRRTGTRVRVRPSLTRRAALPICRSAALRVKPPTFPPSAPRASAPPPCAGVAADTAQCTSQGRAAAGGACLRGPSLACSAQSCRHPRGQNCTP